jgi:4-hydroxy-tetrahydrodipicolinate synthase
MTSILTPATWLTGYIPDIPTPFDEHGAVDLEALSTLCERQIDAGVTAILVSDTSGEASTLTAKEQESIIRAAVKVTRGRVRVVAGAGSNSTSQAIDLAQRAEAAGADAVLSVVPYYNKPMQAGIQAHFRAIAISTALPIILHDAPSRTMRELSDDTLLRLANSRHFIGLKDATGDIARLCHLRQLLPADFRLLSGDDATALPFIANGGDGCISIVSNVAPALCQAVFSNCRLARPQTARYLHDRLLPLTASLTKESPAALKYALFLLGFMSPATRLPIVELTDGAKAEVASAIAEIGDEDIACSVERWHGPRLHEDAVTPSQARRG